jgi:HEAT repeat protein
VRVHAAAALANFADPRLVPYLVAVLSEADAELVTAAVRALGTIGAAAAEPNLLSLLGDPRPAVRRAAADALGQLPL